MDKISPEVKAIVDEYLQKLRENDIHIKEALLFGSQLKGRADKWSDIDIALVSDDFEGNRYEDRNKIRKITLSVNPMLSPLPFRTNDFSEKDPFVKHILKTGMRM